MIIKIAPIIKECCPELVLGCISARVIMQPHNPSLWEIIQDKIKKIESFQIDEIKDIIAIKSSREAYKALGKEPSRYRLSAEALHRRIVRGLGLYQISNVVDIINLISLDSGYSIGGYDFDLITGPILLDMGKPDDAYEAIGRGKMNIENLPVFRDNKGAFGSPTSDSERTMITLNTKNILLIFLNFDKHNDMEDWMQQTQFYIETFAGGSEVLKEIVGTEE